MNLQRQIDGCACGTCADCTIERLTKERDAYRETLEHISMMRKYKCPLCGPDENTARHVLARFEKSSAGTPLKEKK
jgi:hypothetical protein